MGPDVVEFDVYERPTFDKIMKTVSGGDTEDEVAAYVGARDALAPDAAGVTDKVANPSPLSR